MNIVNKGIIIVLQKMNYFIGIIEVSLLKRVMVDLMDLRSSDRHRIPKKIAKSISKTAVVNNEFLAGEKIEFIVKDRTIEICALFNKRCVLNHMSDTATSGIDIYTRHIDKYVWVKTIAPKNCFQMLVNEKIEFEYDVNEVMIYLPSYASLNKLLINNRIHMKPFKTEEKKKIAFYGSSITQGCAASRPGLSYPNILSRLIDCHVSNYGFSESANGEKIVMEYIGKTNCDVVILEYDHNSSIEVLRKAHIVAYKSLRRYTSIVSDFLWI